MQTAQGKAAQGPVASELAAMFTYAVLPTLRKPWYEEGAAGNLGNWEHYKKKCEAFAKQLGIPDAERHRITLPFAISIDWDPRHTWLREVMASAGRCASLREACDEEAIRLQNPTILDEIRQLEENLLACAPPTSHNLADLTQRDAMPARLELQEKQRQLHQLLLDLRTGRGGRDLYLQAYLTKSRKDCRFITVTLEQFMPLSKVSPDLHSPIEHMVRTIKEFVKSEFHTGGRSDQELRQGRTYQEFVNNAVASKGNGPAGKAHIGGSVEKQEAICKVLAASKGKRFLTKVKNKQRLVVGTAGGWIEDTSLT